MVSKCNDAFTHPKLNHSQWSRYPPIHTKSTSFLADPRLWKRSDVSDWLLWAVMFYQVDQVDTSKFAMNGRGLCLLTRSGFMSRAPSCGDILHSDFQRRYTVAVVRTERERRTNRRRLLQVCSEVDSTGETKRPKLAEDKWYITSEIKLRCSLQNESLVRVETIIVLRGTLDW